MSERRSVSAEELAEQINVGEIDTVLVVFPDLQGRLIGKRTNGRFYLEHVANGEGTENCNYLIATDMENVPVPGYRFASYDLGYGDMVALPDEDTIRVTPWVPKTALVLVDLLDVDTGEPIEVVTAPDPPPSGGGRRGHGVHGPCGQRDRVLPLPRQPRGGLGEGLPRPAPPHALLRGLPHPPDDEGRVRHRRSPAPPRSRGRAGRVLEGRGRAGTARDQPRLHDARRDGRPQPRLQERGQGDRPPPRPIGDVHGQVRLRRHRLVVPHPLEPVRRRRATSRAGRSPRRARHDATRSAGTSADSSRRPGSSACCWPRPSTATSGSSPGRGHRPGWPGASTTARSASARWATARPRASSAASPAPTPTATSPSPATLAGGLYGIRNKIDPGDPVHGQRLRG